MIWKSTGHAKVILKATQEQIEAMIGETESIYIRDSGRTQIAPNSLTILGLYWDYWDFIGILLGFYWDFIGILLGFYPSAILKDKFKDFKLL
jgi:hypothetical protein